MDLLRLAEAEKIAKTESADRRKLRIIQVRKQTIGWTRNARKRYEAEKSDQLNKFIDETTAQRKAEAEEVIKAMTKDHKKGMYQIGAAHRAAELINQMNLPTKEEAERAQRNKLAFKRHVSALNTKREREAKESVEKMKVQRLKEDVRQKENMMAKELVIAQPYRVPLHPAGVNQDKSRESFYLQSPTKYLHFPGHEKSPKKRRSKVDVSNVVKKPPAKERKKTSPSAFDIAARDRAAGVTPPIMRKYAEPSSLKPHISRADMQKGDHGEIKDVTYFDASIPLPPVRYKAPPGLVQPESRKSVKFNAWVEGEKLKDEAQRIERQVLLDSLEMERKAQIRGIKALKIAKLEQRYKRLETDLLEENQTQGFQPVLDSTKRDSLLGLTDPQDQDRPDHKPPSERSTSTNAHAAVKSGTSVPLVSAKANLDLTNILPLKGRSKLIFSSSSSDCESSICTFSWPPTEQSSPSKSAFEDTSPDAASGTTHSMHTTSSSNNDSATMAVVEIMCSPGREPRDSVATCSPSAELLLSDAITRLLLHQRTVHQDGSCRLVDRQFYDELSSPSHPLSEEASPEITSGSILTSTPSVRTTDTTTSSNGSTMGVVEIVCSPGRKPRGLVAPSSASAELLLSDALNRVLIHQRAMQQGGTSRRSDGQPHEEQVTPSSSTLSSSATTSSSTSRPIRIPRRAMENVIPRFEMPSSISSIRSDDSKAESDSKASKETHRGTFGRNLSNILYSSSQRSEQHTVELPQPTSAIQKLANEWTQLSIEKPPWLSDVN